MKPFDPSALSPMGSHLTAQHPSLDSISHSSGLSTCAFRKPDLSTLHLPFILWHLLSGSPPVTNSRSISTAHFSRNHISVPGCSGPNKEPSPFLCFFIWLHNFVTAVLSSSCLTFFSSLASFKNLMKAVVHSQMTDANTREDKYSISKLNFTS